MVADPGVEAENTVKAREGMLLEPPEPVPGLLLPRPGSPVEAELSPGKPPARAAMDLYLAMRAFSADVGRFFLLILLQSAFCATVREEEAHGLDPRTMAP